MRKRLRLVTVCLTLILIFSLSSTVYAADQSLELFIKNGGDPTWLGDDSTDIRQLCMMVSETFNSNYSQTGYSFEDVSYNGLYYRKGEIRRDCSGFVTAVSYLLGYKSSKYMTYSEPFSSGLVGTLIGEGKLVFPIGVNLFGELKVGDVIVTIGKGHVAIVSFIDENDVYLADCGSSEKIELTAKQGYAEVYSKESLLSDWRSNGYRIYRP